MPIVERRFGTLAPDGVPVTAGNGAGIHTWRAVRRAAHSVVAVLATAQTFTLDGISARPVRVEVDVHRGLPAFSIVGLPDAAVREARERVRAALINCGFEFPLRRIVVNLAPGQPAQGGPGDWTWRSPPRC